MNEPNRLPDENIVTGIFDEYADTQKEILRIELRKTRNKLITIGVVLLFFSLLALYTLNALVPEMILRLSIIPLAMFGLALLSLKEPLVAMSIATLIMLAIWGYEISLVGGKALLSGWLGKAGIIYLLLAGFQNAREAHRVKKELRS